MERFRHPLWPVVATFIVLCAIYIWAIPPLEGSDEYEHFAYVTWLIEQRSFPVQGEAGWNSPVRQESGQPPLYYLLASLPARLADSQPPVIFRPNRHFRYELDPTLPDNKNTALHYPSDTGGGWRAIYFARVVSVFSGVFLIVCVYGLTAAVLPGRPGAPLAAAAFTAFTPQVIFHSSHVSNDILAAAFSTLALWMLARLVRQPGFIQALAAGAAMGMGALVKVNTLVIGLPAVLAVAYSWAAGGTGRRTRDRARTAFVAGTGLTVGFIAVAGWWFARSWWVYGSLLGLDTHCYQELSTCGPMGLVRPNLIAWRDTFRSFWAAFGLANIRPYDWVYLLFAGLIGLAAVGLGLATVRRRGVRHTGATTPGTIAADRQQPFLLLMMAAAVIANIVLLYFWMQQILATYGRLLFPSLGGFVVLLVAGLWELHPRLARLAWLLPAALAIVSPFWLIHPAYALPRFLDNAALAEKGDPLDWRYGNFAELVSFTPAARSAAAGETLPIEVCWRALAPTAENYTIFLQAIGPDETIVADRYTYPGLGSYPTAIWQADKAFCDTIRMPIPANLARTLVYRLSVGLLDDGTGKRLPGVDPAGNPVPSFVGAVRLEAAPLAALAPPPPGDAPIRLGRADFARDWQPGKNRSVTLHWYAAESVPLDYTVFIHLRNEAGQLIAQADGPPMDGWYPTSWWTPDEWVTDEHTFALPESVPPGSYRLVTGLYDPATGLRLGEEQILGSVNVIEGDAP